MNTNTLTEQLKQPLTVRLVIGLVQGLMFAWLVKHIQDTSISPFILMSALFVVSFVPLLLVQGFGSLRTKTWVMWGASTTVILIALVCYAIYRQPLPHPPQMPSPLPLYLSSIVALFVAHALVLSGDQDKRLVAEYPTYFNISWKLGIQLVSAAVFVGAFWALLWLGASLFKILHLNFFEELIRNRWFAWPATTLATATALHVTDVKLSLITGIRGMCLTLLSWLLPIISIILTLFLLSLLVVGPELLWETGHGATILMVTAVALIILINAGYQDGVSALSTLKRAWIKLACWLLTPVVALAVYALVVRVEQYGWTVARIYGAVGLFLLAMYALGYLKAVIRFGHPLKFIEASNVMASYLIVAIWIALYSPVLDPARLMVGSQVSRLQSGLVSPAAFDYKLLRIEGQRYGQEALQDLQQNKNDLIKKNATDALALNGSLESTKNVTLESAETRKSRITVYPNTATLPDSFLKQDWNRMGDWENVPTCLTLPKTTCQAWMTDKDVATILILDSKGFTGFNQNDQGTWRVTGSWSIPPTCIKQLQAARDGQFTLTPPKVQQPDIEIGGWRTPFRGAVDIDACRGK